jgi:hypothetical protein
MRLAFLAPYPVSTLAPHIEVVGDASNEHPATWIPGLIGSLVQFTDHELHVLTYSDLRVRPIRNYIPIWSFNSSPSVIG